MMDGVRGSAMWALAVGLALAVPAAVVSRYATVPFNVAALRAFSTLWLLTSASVASALQTRTALFVRLPGAGRSDGLADSVAIALQSLTLTVLAMTAWLLLA